MLEEVQEPILDERYEIEILVVAKVGIHVEAELGSVRIGVEEARDRLEAHVVDGLRAEAVAFDVAHTTYHLVVHGRENVQSGVPERQQVMVRRRFAETLEARRDGAVVDLVFVVVRDVAVLFHVVEYPWPAVDASSATLAVCREKEREKEQCCE